MTNLPSVKDLEQTPCHVFHTTEFANINGHIMQCRKVYALKFYDNSYLGYKDMLCNSVTKQTEETTKALKKENARQLFTK